jgi:hypothetical protein
MQTDFQCCGINDPDDWDKNIYFNSSATALKSPEVPVLCDTEAINLNYLGRWGALFLLQKYKYSPDKLCMWLSNTRELH